MQLIKKEEHKLMISNYVGTATEQSDAGEDLTYELMTTIQYSPIIKFPDGDTVVINWKDIIKIAQEYKKDCYKEAENESNKDTNNE